MRSCGRARVVFGWWPCGWALVGRLGLGFGCSLCWFFIGGVVRLLEKVVDMVCVVRF